MGRHFPHTIRRFLSGLEYQTLRNGREIDCQIEKMRKITKRKLGSEDKMVLLRWIAERIASNGQNKV